MKEKVRRIICFFLGHKYNQTDIDYKIYRDKRIIECKGSSFDHCLRCNNIRAKQVTTIKHEF